MALSHVAGEENTVSLLLTNEHVEEINLEITSSYNIIDEIDRRYLSKIKKKLVNTIYSRKRILRENVEFSSELKKSNGCVNGYVSSKFPRLSNDLKTLTGKIHKLRTTYNMRRLKSVEIREEIAGIGYLNSFLESKVKIYVWVNRETGIIEAIGRAKNIFPINLHGEPIISSSLEKVALEVNLKDGQVVDVHANSIHTKRRLSLVVGEIVSMGLNGRMEYWSKKEAGKFIVNNHGWEIICDFKNVEKMKLIAVRRDEWVELGNGFEKVIVRPDILALSNRGMAPIMQEVYLNGKVVGEVIYGIGQDVIMIANVNLFESNKNIYNAVLLYLIYMGRYLNKKIIFSNIIDLRSIIEVLIEEKIDSVKVRLSDGSKTKLSKLDFDSIENIISLVIE